VAAGPGRQGDRLVAGKLRVRYGYNASKEAEIKPADGNTFFLNENDWYIKPI
jgi:hypothetical protein